MLNRLIQFSIQHKLLVGVFVVCLIAWGSYSVTQLPIDAVPDITNNQVQVITTSPSLGAPDVERLITFPVEQACSNIPGIKEMRSFSRFGLSLVTLVFNDDVDVYWARQQVSERLQIAKESIPKGAGAPQLGPVTTGLGEIYQYVVKPKKGFENRYDEMSLRVIQDWIVRRQLLGVKGVADVSSFGGKLKQYEVSVNTAKLNSLGVSLSDVYTALEKNNQNAGGAYIEKGPLVLYIRTEGLAASLADINNIVVKQVPNGMPLKISDVAEVNFGYATRYGAMVYNGEREVAGAVVMMLKGENSNQVIKNVKERIKQIQKNLPEGVVIEPFLDRTKMVSNAISTVEKNLIEGALIVVFVLVLFLGNLRAGLIVASVIPLAMLFAIILMNTFGVSGNLMSLGALDFGLIVDGAVIIVEAVLYTLHHSKQNRMLTQTEMDAEVKHAASTMMNSAVFGQIVILIVYLPIFALQGIEGKMFKPMAQTVSFALIGAFVLSLTYVPMMTALFLSKEMSDKETWSDRVMKRLENWYRLKLNWALYHTKWVILTAVSTFVIAIVLLVNMGGEFIPSLEEGDFAVDTRVLTGSNLNVSIHAAQKASQLLKQNFPEVDKVVAKIGSGEIPTDPMPIEAQDLMVILKDKKEWTSASSFDELSEKMNETLKAVPGVTFGFQYPVQMRFNELMTGARQDVVCKIFGEDLKELSSKAAELGKIAASVEGAQDIWVEPIGGMPQVVISYKRDALALYGLSIEDVNDVVQSAFAGMNAGVVFEGEKRFDLVVRLENKQRKDLSDIENLLVNTKSGNYIPLQQLANVSLVEGPNQIQREDAKRRIIVGFNVRGRDVQSIVNELQNKVNASVKFKPGYYITYGGSFENLEHAKKRLAIAVPVALLLILFMLYMAFGNLKQGLLIYSAIPLSATGGIFALYLRDMPFSISAGIGFIALFGVAVLNGIVLIAAFNRLRKENDNLTEVLLSGASGRLRPVLMTASVASLGFLPMALSSGAGAEVQRPLATVVIGGLIFATLLTLFVLPVLYQWQYKSKKNAAILFLAIICFGSTQTNAQSISLKQALDSCVKNNLNLQSEELLLKQSRALIKSGWNISPTVFQGEVGQINSIYNDNRFSVSQGIQFPMVYIRNTQVLSKSADVVQANVKLKTREAKVQVAQVYLQCQLLKLKYHLLSKLDSVFNMVYNHYELRYKTGDISKLEYLLLQQQRISLNKEFALVNTELSAAISRLNLLLNTKVKVEPNDSIDYTSADLLVQTKNITLEEDLIAKELALNKYKVMLQKSKLWPEIHLAFSNMTIYGVGADNKFYNYGERFNAFSFGLGIPLFFNAAGAEIKAANYEFKSLELRRTQVTKEQQYVYDVLTNKIASLQKILNDPLREKVKLIELTHGLNHKYLNGEIDLTQWVITWQKALDNEMKWLDTQFELHYYMIQLKALNNEL